MAQEKKDVATGKNQHTFFRSLRNLSNIDDFLEKAEQNSAFESYCSCSTKDVFWLTQLAMLVDNAFVPRNIAGISAFDMYRSQYYYNQAVKKGELSLKNDQPKPYLTKALKHHSFLAVTTLIAQIADDELPNKLKLLQLLRPRTATSVLLLYAQVHYKASIKTQDGYKFACLDSAYMYLCLAENYAEESQDALHNHTCGMGLKILFKDFSSIEQAKQYIASLMGIDNYQDLSAHLCRLMANAQNLLNDVPETPDSNLTI